MTDPVYQKLNMRHFVDATTHVSFHAPEVGVNSSYERLEYLGDAIFHKIITVYLYQRYYEENEGFLTRLRIRIERGDSMAELTKILELDRYIRLGAISLHDSILEDVFEAFIGAFYLNFGMTFTQEFAIQLIEKHIDLASTIHYDDNYKDLLLRYFHQMKWGHPVYLDKSTATTSNSTIPDKFTSIVRDPFGKLLGRGTSTTKKEAEQLASMDSLINLGVIVDGEIDYDWLDKIDKEEKEDKKKKKDKQMISVFNPNNQLITKKVVHSILDDYHIKLPAGIKLLIRPFYEATTHRSYLKRKVLTELDKKISEKSVKLQPKSNECMSFLGDSIIHFIVAEFLYRKYKTENEGFLTRLRCRLENRDTLFEIATAVGIGEYVLVSQNIEILHGRNNVNIIGRGFEAFIGALYLQIGLHLTRNFVLNIMKIELDIDKIAETETNYKDLILQIYNYNQWGKPEYRTIKENGPDHSKIFTRGIYLNGRLIGVGTASSKKKAEQLAAKKMYTKYTRENQA